MQTLVTIIVFLLIFSLLILVHELGHFWVAKRNGVKVEEFGMGLPPRIWGKRFGETVYSINWIPFGGFVRMLGEDPTDKKAKKSSRSFMRKTKWQRTKIVCAGVVMNFLLAWVLLSSGFMLGMQPLIVDSSEFLDLIREGQVEIVPGEVTEDVFDLPRPVIYVWTANDLLQTGDMITALDGEQIFLASEFEEFLATHEGETFTIDFVREGEEMQVTTSYPPEGSDDVWYSLDGFMDGHFAVVAEVFEGSPAEEAGMEVGDRVKSINGMEVTTLEEVMGVLSTDLDDTLTYEIERGSTPYTFEVERGEDGMIGIYLGELTESSDQTIWFYDGVQRSSIISIEDVQYPWYEAPLEAFVEMKRISVYTAVMVASLFGDIFATGTVPDQVAGPVGIAQMTGLYVEEGLVALMRFTALLSLSLGVINIFPFPALDGGRLLFIIIEAVRRKPVNARIEAFIHSLGFFFLILVIFLVTFQDIRRLFE